MADDLAERFRGSAGDRPDRDQRARMWDAVEAARQSIDTTGGIPMTIIETEEERVTTGRRMPRLAATALAAVALVAVALAVLRPGVSDDVVETTAEPTTSVPETAPPTTSPPTTAPSTTSVSSGLPDGVGPFEQVLTLWFEEGADAAIATGLLSDSALDRPFASGQLTLAEWLAFYEGSDRDPVLDCREDVGGLLGETCLVESSGVFGELLGRRERYLMVATPGSDGVLQIVRFAGSTEDEAWVAYVEWLADARPENVTEDCLAQGWECVFADDALQAWAESDAFTDEANELDLDDW